MVRDMRQLSSAALENFSEAILCIHRTRGAEEFSANILKAMRLILPADICAVDWYGFQGMDVRTIYDPMESVPAAVNEALHRFAYQNPVYQQGAGTVSTISDFLSRKDWHRTDLHAEGFSRVEQEDGMFLDMNLRKDCRVSLIGSRGKRGFTFEERGMMVLIEPHVRQVFQRLNLQNRIAKSLASPEAAEIPVSNREREVLQWLAEGKSNADIAFLLGISPGTVKKHLENIYTKLGVENRHAAALLALRGRT